MKFIMGGFFLSTLLFYIGFENNTFPFNRMELIAFLSITGGVSMILMIFSSFLFGKESSITYFFIHYAWIAIPLSLIFLSVISAIFIIVALLLLLYEREPETKTETLLPPQIIGESDKASSLALEKIGKVIEEHTNYHLAPTITYKIFTVTAIVLFICIIFFIAPYIGIFFMLIFISFIFNEPFSFNYEHSYLGEKGYIRLERKEKPPSEILKEEIILFDNIYTMNLSSKIECSKALRADFFLFDKKRHLIGTMHHTYNDMAMSIEKTVSERLFNELKDKNILFDIHQTMLVDFNQFSHDGIYIMKEKIFIMQGENEYFINNKNQNQPYTHDGKIFFSKRGSHDIIFTLDDFTNSRLLLLLIAYTLTMDTETLLYGRFSKETICQEGGGGGGG